MASGAPTMTDQWLRPVPPGPADSSPIDGFRLVVDPLLQASPLDLVIAGAIVLGLVVIGIEIAVLAASGRRRLRSFLPAVMMGAGGLAVSSLVAPLILVQYRAWRSIAPENLLDWWQDHPVLAAITTFVAFDAVSYVHHLVGHRTAVGRAAHLPHHSGRWFDLSLALRQSWVPVHGVVVLPVVGLIGVQVEWFLVVAGLSQLWQMLQHTVVDPPGHQRVQRWLVTPAVHELHHRADPQRPVNLGAVLCVWDRMAGTYQAPFGQRSPHRALADDRRSVFDVQFGGWWRLIVGGLRPVTPGEHPRNWGTDAPSKGLMRP